MASLVRVTKEASFEPAAREHEARTVRSATKVRNLEFKTRHKLAINRYYQVSRHWLPTKISK